MTDHPHQLYAVEFTEADQARLVGFSCGDDCDRWSEGETEWHLAWKRRFPRQWREIVMDGHRADIKAPQGGIELQSSSISTVEIASRENF